MVIGPVDVVAEQGGGQIVEADEVAGRGVTRVGHKEVVGTLVTPQEDVADGMLLQDGGKRVRPPVFGLDAVIAGLCHGDGFAVLLANSGEHGELAVKLLSVVGNQGGVTFWSVAIVADAQYIDDVIARILLQVFLLGGQRIDGGGIDEPPATVPCSACHAGAAGREHGHRRVSLRS